MEVENILYLICKLEKVTTNEGAKVAIVHYCL